MKNIKYKYLITYNKRIKSKKYNNEFFYYYNLYSYIAYFIKYNYICHIILQRYNLVKFFINKTY
jgi:hypothetical protein